MNPKNPLAVDDEMRMRVSRNGEREVDMREERRRKRKLWKVSIFLTIALNFANQRPFFQQYSHSMHNDGQINDLVSLPCRFGGDFYRFHPFDISSPCIIVILHYDRDSNVQSASGVLPLVQECPTSQISQNLQNNRF